jgi:hypothetical protein
MTMACLCEVRRPDLAAGLAIRGSAFSASRATIATLRPPADGVFVAGLSAGASIRIGLRRAWRGALMVPIEGGDQAALAAGVVVIAARTDASVAPARRARSRFRDAVDRHRARSRLSPRPAGSDGGRMSAQPSRDGSCRAGKRLWKDRPAIQP